jgi:hypothetical protein
MTPTIEMLTPQSLQTIREKAQEILQQARTQSTFRQKVAASPTEVLRSFGLSLDMSLASSLNYISDDSISGGCPCFSNGTCNNTCRATAVEN